MQESILNFLRAAEEKEGTLSTEPPKGITPPPKARAPIPSRFSEDLPQPAIKPAARLSEGPANAFLQYSHVHLGNSDLRGPPTGGLPPGGMKRPHLPTRAAPKPPPKKMKPKKFEVSDDDSYLDNSVSESESVSSSFSEESSSEEVAPPKKVRANQRKMTKVKGVSESTSVFMQKQMAGLQMDTHMEHGRTYSVMNTEKPQENPSLTKFAKHCPTFDQLKWYQKYGAQWLYAHHKGGFGCVLADEMGLGKTAQTLNLLQFLKKSGKIIKPVVIVCPASLSENWVNEIKKWSTLTYFKYHNTHLKTRLEEGENRVLLQPVDRKPDIIVTTPHMLQGEKDKKEFFKKIKWSYCIVDEAHALRNKSTKTYQSLESAIRSDFRVLLTGTPVQNNLSELCSIIRFCNPKIFALTVLRDLLDDTRTNHQAKLSILQDLIAPFILRRLKGEVLSELPEKSGVTVYCSLSAKQQRLYDRELIVEAAPPVNASAGMRSRFVQGTFARLRRVCNHPMLLQNINETQMKELAKFLMGNRHDYMMGGEARVLKEIRGWSDFQILKECISHGQAGLSFCESLGICVPSPVVNQQISTSSNAQLTYRELPELDVYSGKIRKLLEIISVHKDQSKILIFSLSTQYLDIIQLVFQQKGLNFHRIDGTLAMPDRESAMQDFQNLPDVRLFLLSTKAAGQGLNLTAANIVVMMDFPFNPQVLRQAEDRVHRLGQKLPVTVYYLLCPGTMEDKIINICQSKLKLDERFGGQSSVLETEIMHTEDQLETLFEDFIKATKL